MGEMYLNALLFSKSPETAELPAAALHDLGIRLEVCTDIFSAIKTATQQSFSCLIVDWSDRPEAGFLLKRARESVANRNTVAIAIVEHVPSPVEEQENRLDFFIHRPIVADEVREVLAKACRQMKEQVQAALDAELVQSFHTSATQRSKEAEDPNPASVTSEAPQSELGEPQAEQPDFEPEERPGGEPTLEQPEHSRSGIEFHLGFRTVCAVVLVLAAVFCVWRSRQTLRSLAKTPAATLHALRESVPALLPTKHPAEQPVRLAITDEQPDAHFSRTSLTTNAHSTLGLIPVETDLPDGAIRLPKAFDFPLPKPELMRSELPPMHVQRPRLPESLRGADPITRPLIVAVGPAQNTPVSTPPPQIPQFSDAVHLSEEQARAMLVHGEEPVYPPEAVGEKLQGPVVLQATIGRDGSVEDLKIVRGYFVLGRAAIAAVKQWQFQPYILNGHPAQAQTVLTVNFSRLAN
jgi:TonB family protein